MIFELAVLLAGLAIYLTYGIWGAVMLLLMSVICFVTGLFVYRRKWLLIAGTAVTALPLLLLKTAPLTGLSLAFSFGLSYFSLQMISYIGDVYMGKTEAEKSFPRFLLYVSYLPHMFVGPIERYGTFRLALMNRSTDTYENLTTGLMRAAWGGFKKIVIANRLSVPMAILASDTERFRGIYALAAMFVYSIQLYCDFSGGMDMALGVSKMLGIGMSENFDRPYFSETVQEFWRKWHITLGSWLRDHIYIPLGGNRKGKLMRAVNLVITFLGSGLWHGIHYILWGIINGLLVVTGDLFKTKNRTVNRVITFILISVLWSFFIWQGTGTALSMMGSVFTDIIPSGAGDSFKDLGLTLTDALVLIPSLLILLIYDCRKEKIDEGLKNMGVTGRWSIIMAMALIILVFGTYGLGFNATDFIYSRF